MYGQQLNFIILIFVPVVLFVVWFFLGPIVLISLLFAIFALYSLRIVTRHLVVWNIRKIFFLDGGMSWFKITPDNRKQLGDQMEQANEIISQITSTLDANVNVPWPYLNRGVFTVLWNKDKPLDDDDTPKLSCYVGISRNKLRSSEFSTIVSLAEKLGGTVKKIKGSPNFNVKSYSFGRLNDITMGKVTDGKKSTISPVSETILNEENFYGMVIMVCEMMRKRSEETRWKRLIAQQGSRESGSSKEYSGLGAVKADYILENSYRTCVAAASYDNNKHSAEHMLNSAISALNEPGITASSHDPATYHNRGIIIAYVLFLLTIFGLFYANNISLFQFCIFAILSSLIGIPALFNSSLTGRNLLFNELKHGNIVIPNFMFFSPRWLIVSVLQYYRNSAGSNESTKNRHAIPSARQVLIYHHVPIASFMALPKLTSYKEVDMKKLPDIGVSQDYVKLMNKDDLFIGIAGVDSPMYYPIDNIQYPMFCAGGMGSGKSNFLQVLYLNICFQSARKAKGFTITPIWGETKGKGANDTWNLVSGFRGAVFLDVNNPQADFRIALEGPRIGEVVNNVITDAATVDKNAAELAAMFKMQWGDSIGPLSDDALTYGFKVAMLLNSDELRMLDLVPYVHPEKPNVIKLCQIMLGNDDKYQVGGMLETIRDNLDEVSSIPFSREDLLSKAISAILPFNDKKNRKYRDAASAPKNKLSKLIQATSYWETDSTKKDIYIRDIIIHGAPVVINTGAFKVSDSDDMDKSITDELSHLLLGCIVYSIWQNIQSIGTSWEERNIRVVQFYDEVSHISENTTGNIEDPITGQVNEGRSYGDGLFMATQQLERLPEHIAAQVLATPSRIWFRQDSSVFAVLRDLGEDSPFSESNLKGLVRSTGIANIQTSLGKTGPFVLHVPYTKVWIKYLKEHKNMVDAANAYVADKLKEDDIKATFNVNKVKELE